MHTAVRGAVLRLPRAHPPALLLPSHPQDPPRLHGAHRFGGTVRALGGACSLVPTDEPPIVVRGSVRSLGVFVGPVGFKAPRCIVDTGWGAWRRDVVGGMQGGYGALSYWIGSVGQG